MLKRKIYSKLVDWKKNDKGKTALLAEGIEDGIIKKMKSTRI